MKYIVLAVMSAMLFGCAVGTQFQVASKTVKVDTFDNDLIIKRLNRRGWRIEKSSSNYIETVWRRNYFNPWSLYSFIEVQSRIIVRAGDTGAVVVTGDCMYRRMNRPGRRGQGAWRFYTCLSPYKSLVAGSVETLVN